MRGYIRPTTKGAWQIQIYLGKGPDGKPRRHFEAVKGRKGDAQRRLTELLSSLDKGVYTPPGRLTVAEHLHQWLDGYVGTNCSPRTLDGYTSIIETHLIPELGQLPLKSLQPQAIQKYYTKACKTLSARTVHHQHRVLSQSLKFAVRQGYLGRNPAELVDPPKPDKKTMRTMTSEEVEALLNVAAGSQYYPVIYTAVSTGLRQAELLGLRWRDVDLDMLSISVCQVLYKRRGVSEFKTPKTDRSSRRVAMTPKLAVFLRGYRADREAIYRKIGEELTPDSLVFTNIDTGKVISPNVLSHAFKVMAEKAGVVLLKLFAHALPEQ